MDQMRRSVIKADVVRWTEAVFDRPLARSGRKRRSGNAIHIGEREVAAEVLGDPNAKGFVTLLVRACRTVSARDNWPIEQLKVGSEIDDTAERQRRRLAWDAETARAAVVGVATADV